MDVLREDWRDECKIRLDVMSGDRKEEERAECWRETAADGGRQEPGINNEIGLICGGVVRGHRGGKWGRTGALWDRVRGGIVWREGEMDRWTVEG